MLTEPPGFHRSRPRYATLHVLHHAAVTRQPSYPHCCRRDPGSGRQQNSVLSCRLPAASRQTALVAIRMRASVVDGPLVAASRVTLPIRQLVRIKQVGLLG